MEINYLAVILAGIASMVLGFIWYGPLFSKVWMREIGFVEEDIKGGPGIGYLITFIAALISAAVTSVLVNELEVNSLLNGLLFGLMIGIGYVGTTFASNYIFGRKSLKLYLIDAGYQIINVTIAALISVALR